MKKKAFILLKLFLLVSVFVSAQEYERYYYEQQARKYERWSYAGIAMGAFGIGATAAGATLISKASWDGEDDILFIGGKKGLAGTVLLGAGVPLTVIGIIFIPVGFYKSKLNKRKAANIPDISYSPINHTIVLRYRF